MVNIDFKVIGVDDVTIDPTVRFRCSTSYGDSIIIGSESTNSTCHIWEYREGEWKRITDNLAAQDFRTVNSIVEKDGELFVGLGREYLNSGYGQVWSNGSKKWTNTGLTHPSNLNHAIRKLVKVGNDIYAAGSYFCLYKFDGSSWTIPINPLVAGSPTGYTVTSNLFNWVDIETDGSSVYASVDSDPLFPVSGVIRYDGTSITQFSPNVFGDANNFKITKLSYLNGKLYAGTYNESDGAQVWSKSVTASPATEWDSINTAGFGDRHNYMVVDMKPIGSSMVVSVINPSGGQVWAYNPTAQTWTKQIVNSDALYDSYLIQSHKGSNYLIGTKKLLIVPLNDDTVVYTTNQRNAKKLNNWPDGGLTCVPIGNGRYRFNGPNVAYIAVTEGTLDDPAQVVLSPVSALPPPYTNYAGLSAVAYTNILDKKSDSITGLLNQVFDRSGTSGIAYWGAGNPIYKDQNTGIVLNPAYTEEGYWDVTGGNSEAFGWLSYVRLLVSFDNASSYYDCGNILTPPVYPIPSAFVLPGGGSGATIALAAGGILKEGDYLYIYYGGDTNNLLEPGKRTCLARAPLSEVINAALNKQTSPWTKYYNGSFSQPGLGGSSTDLFPNTYAQLGGNYVYYGEKFNKYVLFRSDPLIPLDPSLYILTLTSKFQFCLSNDGYTPGHSQILGLRTFASVYPSVVGDNTYRNYIDDTFACYVNSGVATTTFSALQLSKFNASTLEVLEKDRSFTVGKYLPALKLSYTIDRGQLDPIYATMHDIVENRKIYEASSNYPVPNVSSTSAYQNYLRETKWKNIYQSYANSATEVSGWGINSVENYYNFRFGNDLHKLYNIYTKEFNRHRLTEDLQYLDGANIFSHTYGPILYNHDLNYLGSSNLVISSLTSYDNTLNKNNIFASANQASGVYSSVAVFDSGYDLYNSSIVDGVDLVSLSGSVNTNYFGVIKIPFSERKKNSSDYMFNRTFIKMDSAGGSPYNQRLRFDISRKNLDSNLGYPLQNNFLLPDHEFKLNLKGIILNTNGTESGGPVGVWIHTQVEDGKYWSYDVNGNWTQHSVTGLNGVYFPDRSRYIHSLNTPEVNRQFASGTESKFKCIDVITDDSNPVAPIYNLDGDDFYNLTLTFNTYNNYCGLGENKGIITDRNYGLSYGQVHRKNQKYFIEIFSFATNDRYLLLDEVTLIDSTMNEMAKTPAIFSACPQPKIELSKNQLHSLFTFWNDIAGKNHKVGYASRDSTETSGVMYSQGGSKLDYRVNTMWFDRTYSSGGATLSSIEVTV